MLNLKRKPKRLILWVTVPFESLAGSETQGDGHTQAEGPARTGQVRGMRESRSSCEWPLALPGFGGGLPFPKTSPDIHNEQAACFHVWSSAPNAL